MPLLKASKAVNPLLLYLILDPVRCGGHQPALRLAESALAGGITTIQLRAKKMPKSEMLSLATDLRALMDQRGYGEGKVPLVINDHADVAVSCGADGVHVGQEDEAVGVARQLVGPNAVVGLSARNEKEGQSSTSIISVSITTFISNIQIPVLASSHLPPGCVDYLGLGAVFPSGTKAESKPIGVSEFHRLCRLTQKPVVAIGGITARNLEELVHGREENFKGVAVSEAICGAEEPERAARELLDVLRGAGMADLRDSKAN